MKLTRVLSKIYTEPWAIRPDVHMQIASIVRAHAQSGDLELLQHELAAKFPEKQPNGKDYTIENGVAVIHLEGILIPTASGILKSSGIVSTRDFISTLRDAVNDEAAQAIVIVADSPGGDATLIPEAASAVRAATQIKPVLAYVDTEAASGAYWIVSQADAIYSTVSGTVGSIGVYIALLDESRAYEMEGLELKLYRSGPFKALGIGGKPVTEEDGKFLQSRVDKLSDIFFAAVRIGRYPVVVNEQSFDGRWFDADEGLGLGLIDGIASFEAVMDEARYRAQKGM